MARRFASSTVRLPLFFFKQFTIKQLLDSTSMIYGIIKVLIIPDITKPHTIIVYKLQGIAVDILHLVTHI